MKQFGLLTYALDPSQQGVSFTLGLNRIVETYNSRIDPIVFYKEYYQQIITPLFCMMQEVEMWNFPHTVISTTLENTTKLLSCPIPTKKLFYILNLEWLYEKNQNYELLRNIYNNKSIELIVKSQDHFNIVKSCWKKPIGIVEDIHFEKIVQFI